MQQPICSEMISEGPCASKQSPLGLAGKKKVNVSSNRVEDVQEEIRKLWSIRGQRGAQQ